MSEAYSGYVRKERVDPEKYILAKFYLKTKGDLLRAMNAIAGESSIGTWTEVKTFKPEIKRLGCIIYDYEKLGEGEAIAHAAYPLELFENGNVPQLLSDIAGNIFGMKEVEYLRLLDVEFPKAYVREFLGPAFGIEGVRRIVGTTSSRRPHVGTIVKPKVGLKPKEFAEVAYKAWRGGLDFVKDDENLTSQSFCPFEERVIHVLEAKDKAEEETGEKKMYAPNITAKYDVMLERADFVKDHGGNCVMIDVVTAGFSALQSFVEEDIGLPIHAHRAMHAAFTRLKFHGISMLVLAKLLRLVGVDQLHIGGIVGKMEGGPKEVMEIRERIQEVGEKWPGIRPVMAVASGGLHPGSIPAVVKYLGRDVVIQAGGGVHGHPWGTEAGAKAMRDAVEAVMKGIKLEEYESPELQEAIKKWGVIYE